jgi:hypothetical protein
MQYSVRGPNNNPANGRRTCRNRKAIEREVRNRSNDLMSSCNEIQSDDKQEYIILELLKAPVDVN